jgi:non-lysosomal glucosylceramidase
LPRSARRGDGNQHILRSGGWADGLHLGPWRAPWLFTGEGYRVDTDGPVSNASFIEQLLGPFLARHYGVGDIIPKAHARKALRSLYKINFQQDGRGIGAVSLARITDAARRHLPHTDDTGFQTSEIQPGFNFSFAAQLEEWGCTPKQTPCAAIWDFRHLRPLTPAA